MKKAKANVYMDDQMRGRFKSQLLAWKDQLLQDASSTLNHLKKDTGARLPDLFDEATLLEELRLELRTRERERRLIQKIEQALVKIDRQDYGYCEECGEPIGEPRLSIRPIVGLCFDCKSLREIKEKQGS